MDDFHKQPTLPDLHAGVPKILPKQIGPYKIDSLLNKGGMSVVYLGVHPETAQPIVVKVLLPKYCKNKEMASRFLKEAEIIGMAHHPNIVRLYGQGEWEKGLYIAMEFIQGVSLRQFIQQKSLSHKRALEIVLQVAYALCHLHTHGVIHRDLKPENILITETGEIKLIDFGIAQVKGLIEQQRITQKNRLMGTPVYMSPEQKENPSLVTYSSDIYSLGIIAYELILGRLSHGVIHLALLSKRFQAIIEKALQPDPKERYQDIVDFITDLSQYIHTLSDDPEEKEEAASEELLQIIQKSNRALIPKAPPHWPSIEIGMAIHKNLSLSGLYLDFFHLQENRYGIVLAESLEAETFSFSSISILCGMIRMAMRTPRSPLELLQELNQTLHQDPLAPRFALSLLVLSPDKNQLFFASCGHTDLYHIREGTQIAQQLTTPNPALGADPNTTFLQIVDNWLPGDNLILYSLHLHSKKKENDWLNNYLLLSPQNQAEKILHAHSSEKKIKSERTSVVLSLQRIF